MKYIVLGAGGFIGTNLVRAIARQGTDVLAVGRNFQEKLPNVQYAVRDLKVEDIYDLVGSNDVVIDLIHGSIPSSAHANFSSALQTSIEITLKVVKTCVSNGASRLIYASSGGTVYGQSNDGEIGEDHATNPYSGYGIAKLAIEKLLLMEGFHGTLDPIVLRIGNPYGPWQRGNSDHGLVPRAIEAVMTGRPISIFGDGTVVRDYVFVDDLCTAIVDASRYRGRHRVFNIGGGAGGRSIVQVIAEVARVAGKDAIMSFQDQRPFDVQRNVLNIGLAGLELGWNPKVSLREGIEKTFEWLSEATCV